MNVTFTNLLKIGQISIKSEVDLRVQTIYRHHKVNRAASRT